MFDVISSFLRGCCNLPMDQRVTHKYCFVHTCSFSSFFWLIPCNGVLSETLTFAEVVKKFFTLIVTRRLINIFTRSCRLSLFKAKWIHVRPWHWISSIIRFNSILTCTSVSLKRSFPLRVFNCSFAHNTHVFFSYWISYKSHRAWFNHSNNIWHKV